MDKFMGTVMVQLFYKKMFLLLFIFYDTLKVFFEYFILMLIERIKRWKRFFLRIQIAYGLPNFFICKNEQPEKN